MKVLEKKLISILSIVALLLAVSGPVYGGGEHPWDSDGNTGNTETHVPGSDDDSGASAPSMSIGVGPTGIITGLGDLAVYFWTSIFDMGQEEEKLSSPEIQTASAMQQSEGM